MMDLAEVSTATSKTCAAGCKHVQLDEPLFAIAGTDEGRDQGGRRGQQSVLGGHHGLQVAARLPGELRSRCALRRTDRAPLLRRRNVPSRPDLSARLRRNHERGRHDPRVQGTPKNQQLAIGVADVQDLNVESPETLVDRVNEWSGSWLEPERTLITSSCGMNHLPRNIANGKLGAMAKARMILRERSA